jgi:hypothetical protein
MKAAIRHLVFTCVLIFGLAPFATAESKVLFGPYEALTINSEIIRGVKVDEAGKIWLLLNPTYREQEIIVKISSENGAGYRKWFTGNYELVSPANQGKQANQWTDWIETVSPYIEYWMSGEKILHLKKVK